MKKGIKRFLIMLIACFLLSLGFGACSAQSPTDSTEISNSTVTSKEVYYESQIRFYVNPENSTWADTGGGEYGVYGAYGEHVMDSMVKLLNEDAFAEEMLLRSQDTSAIVDNPDTDINEKDIYKYLPMKDVWTNETEADLAEALNIEIDEAIYYVQAILIAEDDLIEAQKEYLIAANVYSDKLFALSSEWNSVFLTTYGEYSKEKYENLTAADRQHERFCYVEEAYLANCLASETLKIETDKVSATKEALRNAKRNAQAPCIEVFTLWEQTAKYKTLLAKYSETTHFSFLLSNENTESGNNFARSFIYANISVKGEDGYGLANELYEILKELVPEYVEANMAIPSGYTGTNCQRISRNDAPQRIEK